MDYVPFYETVMWLKILLSEFLTSSIQIQSSINNIIY